MNRDECLKKLKEACSKFEKIGNVVEFKQNNPDALFGYIQPIVQYYNYIRTNFKDDDYAVIDAMATVLEVGENNPSLKGIVNSIARLDKPKQQEQSFDKTSLINKITAIVNECKSQNVFDTNTVGDYQYALEQCLSQLNANLSYFTQPEYEELTEMISKELGKINRLNEYIENNSTEMNM